MDARRSRANTGKNRTKISRLDCRRIRPMGGGKNSEKKPRRLGMTVRIDNTPERRRLNIQTEIGFMQLRYDDLEELIEVLAAKYKELLAEAEFDGNDDPE